jgi:AraC-like DNA-binding protein
MKKSILKVCLNDLRGIISGIKDEKNIFVFDNFDEPFNFTKITTCCLKFDFSFTIFVLEGSMTIGIDNKNYYLETNDWAIVLKGRIFHTTEFAANSKVGVCCYGNGFWDTSSYMSKAINFYNSIVKKPVIRFPQERALKYIDVFMHLKKYVNHDGNAGKINILKGYCSLIFLMVCDIILEKENYEDCSIDHKVTIYKSFLQCVEKYYKQDRSVRFYADKLRLPPQYLSSVIYQLSGKHAFEWLEAYVGTEIDTLLTSQDRTIQQIACDLNFEDSVHLKRFLLND